MKDGHLIFHLSVRLSLLQSGFRLALDVPLRTRGIRAVLAAAWRELAAVAAHELRRLLPRLPRVRQCDGSRIVETSRSGDTGYGYYYGYGSRGCSNSRPKVVGTDVDR